MRKLILINIAEFLCFLIEDSLRIHKEKLVRLYGMKTDFKKIFQEIVVILNSRYISNDSFTDIDNLAQQYLTEYRNRKNKSTDDVQSGYTTFISPLFEAFMSGCLRRVSTLTILFGLPTPNFYVLPWTLFRQAKEDDNFRMYIPLLLSGKCYSVIS
ncbi:MAG: hypothetical protein M9933_16975 [Chitinophagaceae bacterium]|nr:hypothetical protein [Chitinophagaceae bacterium]